MAPASAFDAIGIGSSALTSSKGSACLCWRLSGRSPVTCDQSPATCVSRQTQAEMYWKLREALDPTAEHPIALPPDSELTTDLAAVRYKVVQMGQDAGIQIRDKDEIREAIGRSPDKGTLGLP